MSSSSKNRSNTCKECNKKISSKDKAVSCDTCFAWVCLPCSCINEKLYDLMVETGDRNLGYTCNNCKEDLPVLREIKGIKDTQEAFRIELDKVKVDQTTTNQNIELLNKKVDAISDSYVTKEELNRLLENSTRNTANNENITNLIQEAVREEQDSINRRNNLIIYRLKEKESFELEKTQLADLFLKLDPYFSIDSVIELTRIGIKSDGDRPLMVKFESNKNKSKIMANLKKLKDLDHHISIANDMTSKQREQHKKLLENAKDLNANNTNPNFYHKVVGLPGKEYVKVISKN